MVSREPDLPALDDPCPSCGRPVGDHTIRDYGKCGHAAGHDLEMPYTEIEGGPIMFPALGDAIPVGEIGLKAALLDTPLGRLPVVTFSFTAVGATPLSRVKTPEYALILDVEGLRRTKELVNRTINGAIRAVGGGG